MERLPDELRLLAETIDALNGNLPVLRLAGEGAAGEHGYDSREAGNVIAYGFR